MALTVAGITVASAKFRAVDQFAHVKRMLRIDPLPGPDTSRLCILSDGSDQREESDGAG